MSSRIFQSSSDCGVAAEQTSFGGQLPLVFIKLMEFTYSDSPSKCLINLDIGGESFPLAFTFSDTLSHCQRLFGQKIGRYESPNKNCLIVRHYFLSCQNFYGTHNEINKKQRQKCRLKQNQIVNCCPHFFLAILFSIFTIAKKKQKVNGGCG